MFQCIALHFNEEPWNDGWSEQAAFERLSIFTRIPNFHGIALTIDGEPTAMALGWASVWHRVGPF